MMELRVALPGVQILIAFLLTVPFSQGWQRLTAFHRDVSYVTLIATALFALAGSVLLITDVLFDGARVWIYSGAVWVVIVVLWFVRPLSRHVRGESSGPAPRP